MKSALRNELLAKRRAISAAERQQAAEQAAVFFSSSHFFQQSQHIACYLAQRDEFNCSPIIEAIWAAKKKCYLPVISDTNTLHFASYEPNDELQPNRYRILEPVHQHLFPTENLDLVIAPLVGFDLQGNRLGMGGGYYDKTFAFLRSDAKKIAILGLGYAEQQVDSVPHDEWDVALDGVITEKKLFSIHLP